MSPIRGDVKKEIFLSLSERRGDVVACIQPNLSSGEAVGSPRIPDRPGSWRFVLVGFMTRWCGSTPSVLEATQANGVALLGQPWSYLRLKAYSFFGLCEGAYGAFGGSVLKDCTQGLTH
jgi:hypothetical protein